ncbi:MAG: hypothetical protein LBC02_10060 [Planctomycetaceae bacterium]|jgi:hypothetical protein|nr:hypothetical protein [Planctomycetaceae bacterium]
MKLFQILMLFLPIPILVGCFSKEPDGFPHVYPATITITQDGKPLEGAVVVLEHPTERTRWSAGGKTDATGSVQPATVQGNYSVSGVPAEDFLVTIMKNPVVEIDQTVDPETLTPQERDRLNAEYEQKMIEARKAVGIPEILSDPQKTPLRWKVTTSGTNVLHVETGDYK